MQKKNILILFIIFINLSFSTLSKNDKFTRSENVEFRNGYYYIIGEKERFSDGQVPGIKIVSGVEDFVIEPTEQIL